MSRVHADGSSCPGLNRTNEPGVSSVMRNQSHLADRSHLPCDSHSRSMTSLKWPVNPTPGSHALSSGILFHKCREPFQSWAMTEVPRDPQRAPKNPRPAGPPNSPSLCSLSHREVEGEYDQTISDRSADADASFGRDPKRFGDQCRLTTHASCPSKTDSGSTEYS